MGAFLWLIDTVAWLEFSNSCNLESFCQDGRLSSCNENGPSPEVCTAASVRRSLPPCLRCNIGVLPEIPACYDLLLLNRMGRVLLERRGRLGKPLFVSNPQMRRRPVCVVQDFKWFCCSPLFWNSECCYSDPQEGRGSAVIHVFAKKKKSSARRVREPSRSHPSELPWKKAKHIYSVSHLGALNI